MNTGDLHQAPWSWTLSIVTTLTVLFMLYLAVIGFVGLQDHGWAWFVAMCLLPVTIILAGALFTVSGYRLVDGSLWVRRFGWYTKIALTDLISARVDPDAMGRSWRVFGNGGLFSFSGWYSNAKLGRFRVFATDPSLSVVLRYPDKVIVVTPRDPNRLVSEIMNTAKA
ncbi:MAG: PH domain-containing protein [Pseudomonadota bacterium]